MKKDLPNSAENRIIEFAKERLKANDIAHNYEHSQRIVKLCKMISKFENANLRILIPAAYLHDIASRDEVKKHQDHVFASEREAIKFLNTLDEFSENELENIGKIMNAGASENYMAGGKALTIEEKVLRDAGILDAIGAVGIARVFAFGGHYKQEFGNPINPEPDTVFQYIFTNVLKRNKKLQTKSAKKIGKNRLKVMKNFIEDYKKEFKGKK